MFVTICKIMLLLVVMLGIIYTWISKISSPIKEKSATCVISPIGKVVRADKGSYVILTSVRPGIWTEVPLPNSSGLSFADTVYRTDTPSNKPMWVEYTETWHGDDLHQPRIITFHLHSLADLTAK